MRVFIAVDFPEEVKSELVKVQSELEDVKLSITREFHITLKFLGEVPDEKIDLIKENLSKIKLAKFKVKLDELGVFPSENYIRVIWVGLKPAEKLIDLNARINNSLKEFPDDFKFHPHITLARVKFIENKKEFVEKLKSIKIKPVEFEVAEFKLKKSTLTPRGPVYSDLGVF